MKINARYTIHTEALKTVPEIVAKYFQAFTINYGTGFWNGKQEKSVSIVVVAEDNQSTLGKIRLLASELKKVNKQEAVLIDRQQVTSELI